MRVTQMNGTRARFLLDWAMTLNQMAASLRGAASAYYDRDWEECAACLREAKALAPRVKRIVEEVLE